MAAVNPLPKEKAAPELAAVYDDMSKKFGRMPNLFAVMAQRPTALRTYLPFYAGVTAEGTIDASYKTLAFLKAALINGCEYDIRAHTAAAKKLGISEEKIKALSFFHRSPLFDDKEKTTLLYAERVTRGAAGIRDRTLQDLKKYYGEDQIVELTLIISLANFTNRFNDALQIEPDLGKEVAP